MNEIKQYQNDITERIRSIKQSFRLMMDGAVAHSMREKGLQYNVNWGVTLPRLREKADEIGKNGTLATALWKENSRECKILATMIMPSKEMTPELTDLWMEQTPTIEIAEQAAFNLFQFLPYAAYIAYRWVSKDNYIYQICGFHIFSRLFIKKCNPNERGINEFIDQVIVSLQSQNISVRKAAMQSLIRFMELNIVYERIAKSALKQNGLSICLFDYIT